MGKMRKVSWIGLVAIGVGIILLRISLLLAVYIIALGISMLVESGEITLRKIGGWIFAAAILWIAFYIPWWILTKVL